jgi:ATP-dependent Lon protease
MENNMLDQKIKNVFSEMVVLKNPKRTEFFSNLSLPSYMRDWLVMKFSDSSGNIEYESVLNYIKQYIPSREDFEQIKYQMINGEPVRFLARIRVSVNTKLGLTEFELPDFGGSRAGAGGEVRKSVVEKWQEVLLRENENWGVLELIWHQDFSTKQGKGIITLSEYTPFCPYTVDLGFYREARKQFSTQEWVDVLISAVDYNPKGYDSERQKLYFLRRLLPFVERRVNLIELAPKGTGKSYVYQKISKRGWLIAGGTVSRAALIYDNAKKMGGLITRFDFVAFDEIQTMRFDQPSQIQTALKHYMEFGEIKGFDAQMASGAGIVVLGNIDAEKFDTRSNMVEAINPIFRESATLDRFHGVIPGWEIPRLNQDIIADGWALNTEYFAEVLHELRGELVYSAIVDECLHIPPKADQRDLVAIKRLCTAFLKLIFPNVTSRHDIPKDEFIKYCLGPAKEMRMDIKKQLCVVDPAEFDVPGKRTIPNIQYQEFSNHQ